MQDKIKEIREKCIEANPSILDLKFGCEVLNKNSNQIDVIIDNSVAGVSIMRNAD